MFYYADEVNWLSWSWLPRQNLLLPLMKVLFNSFHFDLDLKPFSNPDHSKIGCYLSMSEVDSNFDDRRFLMMRLGKTSFDQF